MQMEKYLADANKTQRAYARLAGSLFLGVIILAFGGGFIVSHVAGNGSFAETAARIASSERLYRAGLSIMVIASLGSALLAFALYATLKPVNSFLAQLAMIFCLGDSFLALIVRMCDFVRLHLYATVQTPEGEPIPRWALADLMRSIAGTTENIAGISFGIGSLLFFWLFFKSRNIPRAISTLGLFASVTWVVLYFASLILPNQRSRFQLICFPPMGVADLITGMYLLFFAVKVAPPIDPPDQRSAIPG